VPRLFGRRKFVAGNERRGHRAKIHGRALVGNRLTARSDRLVVAPELGQRLTLPARSKGALRRFRRRLLEELGGSFEIAGEEPRFALIEKLGGVRVLASNPADVIGVHAVPVGFRARARRTHEKDERENDAPTDQAIDRRRAVFTVHNHDSMVVHWQYGTHSFMPMNSGLPQLS
jgi:hypothetical protein